MTGDETPKRRRRAKSAAGVGPTRKRTRKKPASAPATQASAKITAPAVALPPAPAAAPVMQAAAAAPPAPERPWVLRIGRRIRNILLGLVATIVVSAVAERVADKEWLEGAIAVQDQWMAAVEKTQPLAVGGTYWTALWDAFTGAGSTGANHALTAPFMALWTTVEELWTSSGITGLVQIGLATLGLAVFNFVRSSGDTILFGDDIGSLIGMPLAIIALASVGGLILWGLMWGAMWLLGWASGIAAGVAGATGVLGFCYYCVGELVKKGAEHALTRKL